MKNLTFPFVLTLALFIGCKRNPAITEKSGPQNGLLNTLISGNNCTRFERLFVGAKMEDLKSIKQTTDGGYILCGSTETIAENEYDILVVKTDCFGKTEWVKTIDNNYSDFGYYITNISKGGYLLTASFSTGPKSDKLISYKGQFIKLDEKGNVLWEKKYNTGSSTILNKVIETDDSGFVLCGSDQSLGGFVMKIDASGTETWTNYLSSSVKLYDISVNRNKNYVVCGSISVNQQEDIYLAELDPSGKLNWSKSVDKNNITNEALSVFTLANNEIVISGYNRTSGTSLPGFVMRLDASGKEIWYKSFESEGIYSLNKTICTSNNEIITVGSKFNTPVILKLNYSDCSVIGSVEKSSNTFINDLKLTDDGGLIMVGNLFQFAGNRDGYILKTDKDGN